MADKQKLVLIPGLVCDEAVWAHQTAHLADIADITVPPVTEGASMVEMARIALDGAPTKFALAGFSMGGYIALELLRQVPDRITRLALLDTSAIADTPKKAEWRAASISACERGEFDRVIDAMMPLLLHKDQQIGPLPLFVREMVGRVGAAAYLRRHRATGMRQDARDLLRAAKQPVRAICGRQDALNGVADHEEIAALAPCGRCSIIEDCGHMTIIERPQAATALLRDWLLYD